MSKNRRTKKLSREEQLEVEQRMTSLQRNFISMVSHEFRTPLTIIDGHAQRLIKLKENQMKEAIKILDFETAAILRDEIKILKEKKEDKSDKKVRKD